MSDRGVGRVVEGAGRLALWASLGLLLAGCPPTSGGGSSRGAACRDSCESTFQQVCGKDGVTYTNACHMGCADVELDHGGPC